MAKILGEIIISGKPRGRGGAGDSVVFIHPDEELPSAVDAKDDTLYVRLEDETLWVRQGTEIAEVPGSFTDSGFTGGSTVYTWLEELASDPVDDAAASYYNTVNGIFRKKEITDVDGIVTLADATIRTDHTDLGILATEPTDTTDQAIYYNSTDDQFRRKNSGALDDSGITQSTFSLLSSANFIGVYNGSAAATAANSDNTVLACVF